MGQKMRRILCKVKLGCIMAAILTVSLLSYIVVNEAHSKSKPNVRFTSSELKILTSKRDNMNVLDKYKWMERPNSDQELGQRWSRQNLSRYETDGSYREGHTPNDETSRREDAGKMMLNHSTKSISDKRQSINDYCNFPSHDTIGQEGFVPRGYKLEAVSIFFRHGDRTPLSNFRSQINFEINCKFDQRTVGNHKKFSRYIGTLNQYTGKQYPSSIFQNWALYPSQKDCVKSQLTGRGALQHLKLGEHLSKVYVKKWQLLNTYYEKRLQVKCTPYTRTYQSVVAFLYAFLPQFNLTKLNIQEGKTIYMYPESFPRQCSLLQKLQEDSDRYRSSHAGTNVTRKSEILTDIARFFNRRKSELPATWPLFEFLVGYICHSSTDHNKNNEQLLKSSIYRLWRSYEMASQYHMRYDKSFLKMNKLAAYPLLWEVSQTFLHFVKGDQTQNIFIYSGHDKTLIALMISLGIYDGDWPKYASRIVLELYSYDVQFGNKKYVIKCLYNGKDVTERMKFCLFDKHGLCSIESFVQFVFNDFLKTVGIENYHTVCL